MMVVRCNFGIKRPGLGCRLCAASDEVLEWMGAHGGSTRQLMPVLGVFRFSRTTSAEKPLVSDMFFAQLHAVRLKATGGVAKSISTGARKVS